MTKSEFKATTKQWLYSKGFQTMKNEKSIYPMEGFDLFVLFYKSRFDEVFYFDLGFELNGMEPPRGIGQIRAEIPNKKYWQYVTMADGSKHVGIESFVYEDWNKEDYLECLEKIYALYIQPYFDLGFELLKIIAKDPTCGGKFGASKKRQYYIHPNTVKVILSK